MSGTDRPLQEAGRWRYGSIRVACRVGRGKHAWEFDRTGTGLSLERAGSPSDGYCNRGETPRRLDPALIDRCLIVGKSRGLFSRNDLIRFRGAATTVRRATPAPAKTRQHRRWEPVVISPVFPARAARPALARLPA